MPELGKRVAPGQLGRGEASYGSSEAAEEPRQDRGLYIARRGRFPWPRISSPANRLAVARASWRRRALEDEAADELALFQGAGGKPGWLWRHRPWQRRAADAGMPPKALSAALLAARAAWHVAVRRLVRGVAL